MKEKNRNGKTKYFIAFVISCILLGMSVAESIGKPSGFDNDNLFHIVFCLFLAYRSALELIGAVPVRKIWFSRIYILTEIVVYVVLFRYFTLHYDYLNDMNSAMVDFVLNGMVLVLALREIRKAQALQEGD